MPMEENLRTGGRSGIAVKKRNSSGCLVVRTKRDALSGVCASGSSKGSAVKNEGKRPRVAIRDSELSEEDPPLPPLSRRGVAAETIRVCNGLTVPGKHVAEGSELTSWNGDGEEKKTRNRLDVFDFDEYDGIDWEMMLRRRCDNGGIGKRSPVSLSLARRDSRMERQTGSSRHATVVSRKNVYFDRANSLCSKQKRYVGRMPPSAKREKLTNNSDKSIWVQRKNGVLKVNVENKKKPGGSSSDYDQWKSDDNREGSSCEGMVNESAVVLPSSTNKCSSEKHSASSGTEKNQLNREKSVHTDTNDSFEENLGDTNLLLKQRSETVRKNVIVYSSRAKKKRASISRIDGEGPASEISKSADGDLDDINASLKQKSQKVEARDPSMKGGLESERTPKAKVLASGTGVKHGSGTEKQKLREHIRSMLLSAGWEIDYKPRRNRDYLDAVYISPSGTSYWSIIKAYDALQKQLDSEAAENGGDRLAFIVSDEILSQLTRKTQNKMEKELKRQSTGIESKNARGAARKKTSYVKEDVESMQSDSTEEKLSSLMKRKAKSCKGKIANSGLTGLQKKFAEASSSNVFPQRRESRKLGRCTLLIRSSDKGSNSESDTFVSYTGKRTLLSWLIDSGVVELSQKVQYMNQRKTQVLLQGWITRDGIHCGCCSNIITISKFELHAGSKLRRPFQNIYLDSGVSLLQCQKDAWNRLEESDHVGFHRVDVDGDDPNDDTCGICGDGGDLICCDGCPSTFHQSCLNIKMLPQGDWHCPNCTCRYCGVASEHHDPQNHPVIVSELLSCNLCERRFHKSCIKDIDILAVDSFTTDHSFCSQKCKELLDHLQKYLGLKHELEEGFSWSLIRRIDPGSDLSSQQLPQMVECNSKLAVALSVMDECFLPIIDRRTGINMIRNVLYNCRSNFSRINYGGFYTVILERDDEIISAASLRFHGAQLAEMPFIGTRHIYRLKGMCRRLFSAIESVLRSLKIEKLVIPAISELMNTWNAIFGFTPAAESLKQEMRSLNMLVFPGLNMLQKLLFEQETTESERTAALFSGAAAMQNEEGKETAGNPLVSEKSDGDISTGPMQEMDDKAEDVDCDSNSSGGSSNDSNVVNGSSDEGRVHISTELAVKSAESEIKLTGDAPSVSGGSSQEVDEEVSDPATEVSAKLIENGDINDASKMVVAVSSIQSSPSLKGISIEKSKEIVKSNDVLSRIVCVPLSDASHSALEMEEKLGQALKEDKAAEDTVFVNSDSNCEVSHGEGSKSDEPADGGMFPAQDTELGNKSAACYEAECNIPSSTDSESGDADRIN